MRTIRWVRFAGSGGNKRAILVDEIDRTMHGKLQQEKAIRRAGTTGPSLNPLIPSGMMRLNGFTCDTFELCASVSMIGTMKKRQTKRTIDFRHAPSSRWTCIGRPDDHHKTVVREDGALLYDYAQPVGAGRLSGMFHTEIAFHLPCADAPLDVRQDNDDPANSIVVTTVQYPLATLTMHAFGHAEKSGHRTDVVLWRIEAARGVQQFTAGLAISPVYHRYRSVRVDSHPATSAVRLEDASPETPAPPPAPYVLALSPAGYRRSADPMDWYNFAAGYRVSPAGALSRMALLDGGETLEGAVMIPRGHAETGHLDYAWAKRALRDERAFWKKLRIPRHAIEVPDPSVQAMISACARNILQAREEHGGLPEFQVGPTCYRNMWVVDGYYLLQVARYLGLGPDAERGTRALLRRVKPDGAICDIPEHTMETMISVATLVRQAELAGDRAMMEERWPVIMKAVEYVRELRRQARMGDPSSPEYGLLPKAYADGGIGGIRAEYLTTLWTLAGLNHAVRAARWIGRAEDERAIKAEFDSLMADFRARAKRDLVKLPDGTPYLRMWMREQSDHVIKPDFKGKLMPWQKLGLTSGTWAFCQSIYTGELFAPDDPLVKNLLALFDRVDERQGLPEGMGWLLDRSVWPYGGAFAAQVWLYHGRADKAVDYLYAFANHAAPTRVWREEQSLDYTGLGYCNGDMPHNWASAEFIHLVRNLLVVERGDTLELLAGLPAAWCRPGMRTRIDRTPTRFGEVSVDCRCDKKGRVRIAVQLDLGGAYKPGAVKLRLPAGARFGRVTVNGRPMAARSTGWIILPLRRRQVIDL